MWQDTVSQLLRDWNLVESIQGWFEGLVHSSIGSVLAWHAQGPELNAQHHPRAGSGDVSLYSHHWEVEARGSKVQGYPVLHTEYETTFGLCGILYQKKFLKLTWSSYLDFTTVGHVGDNVNHILTSCSHRLLDSQDMAMTNLFFPIYRNFKLHSGILVGENWEKPLHMHR